MGSLTELVNRFRVEPGKNPGEPRKNIGKNSRAHPLLSYAIWLRVKLEGAYRNVIHGRNNFNFPMIRELSDQTALL